MCLLCQGDSTFIAVDQECMQLTENCVIGYYYDGPQCVRCPNNHTTPEIPGIYYRDSCKCMAGFEKKSDVMCTICVKGYYSSHTDSMCIASPRGTFVQFAGSTLSQKCAENWVSYSAASTVCTPCPLGTYSNIHNTLCVPGDRNKVILPTQNDYNIHIFCLDISSRGLDTSDLVLVKNSKVSWDTHRQNIMQHYPNFVSDDVAFATPICGTAFLHSTPTFCKLNMFMMRMHSYIYECVSCPVGMYKNTQTLLYADCKPCSDKHCPELQEVCNLAESTYVLLSHRFNTDHFKNIQQN